MVECDPWGEGVNTQALRTLEYVDTNKQLVLAAYQLLPIPVVADTGCCQY